MNEAYLFGARDVIIIRDDLFDPRRFGHAWPSQRIGRIVDVVRSFVRRNGRMSILSFGEDVRHAREQIGRERRVEHWLIIIIIIRGNNDRIVAAFRDGMTKRRERRARCRRRCMNDISRDECNGR